VILNATWVSATTATRLNHFRPTGVERIARRGDAYLVSIEGVPAPLVLKAGENLLIRPDGTAVKV
jgi:hypothetical protein